jgi:hypothetical protein
MVPPPKLMCYTLIVFVGRLIAGSDENDNP